MVTVIVRWERHILPPHLEWRMWRQLRGAYRTGNDFRLIFVPVQPSMEGYTCEQYETMEEALAHAQGEVCFLEPKGKKNMLDLAKHSRSDITLVVGNAESDNIYLANPEHTYRIDTPSTVDFFGINAVAIALDRWYSG